MNDNSVKNVKVKRRTTLVVECMGVLLYRANTTPGRKIGNVLKTNHRQMQTASSLGRLEETG